MDNKDKAKDFESEEFNKYNQLKDYKLLVQKLKSIKKNITILEKNFLEK